METETIRYRQGSRRFPNRDIGRNFMSIVARLTGSLAILPTARKAFFG